MLWRWVPDTGSGLSLPLRAILSRGLQPARSYKCPSHPPPKTAFSNWNWYQFAIGAGAVAGVSEQVGVQAGRGGIAP